MKNVVQWINFQLGKFVQSKYFSINNFVAPKYLSLKMSFSRRIISAWKMSVCWNSSAWNMSKCRNIWVRKMSYVQVFQLEKCLDVEVFQLEKCPCRKSLFYSVSLLVFCISTCILYLYLYYVKDIENKNNTIRWNRTRSQDILRTMLYIFPQLHFICFRKYLYFSKHGLGWLGEGRGEGGEL